MRDRSQYSLPSAGTLLTVNTWWTELTLEPSVPCVAPTGGLRHSRSRPRVGDALSMPAALPTTGTFTLGSKVVCVTAAGPVRSTLAVTVAGLCVAKHQALCPKVPCYARCTVGGGLKIAVTHARVLTGVQGRKLRGAKKDVGRATIAVLRCHDHLAEVVHAVVELCHQQLTAGAEFWVDVVCTLVTRGACPPRRADAVAILVADPPVVAGLHCANFCAVCTKLVRCTPGALVVGAQLPVCVALADATVAVAVVTVVDAGTGAVGSPVATALTLAVHITHAVSGTDGTAADTAAWTLDLAGVSTIIEGTLAYCIDTVHHTGADSTTWFLRVHWTRVLARVASRTWFTVTASVHTCSITTEITIVVHGARVRTLVCVHTCTGAGLLVAVTVLTLAIAVLATCAVPRTVATLATTDDGCFAVGGVFGGAAVARLCCQLRVAGVLTVVTVVSRRTQSCALVARCMALVTQNAGVLVATVASVRSPRMLRHNMWTPGVVHRVPVNTGIQLTVGAAERQVATVACRGVGIKLCSVLAAVDNTVDPITNKIDCKVKPNSTQAQSNDTKYLLSGQHWSVDTMLL